MCAGKRCRPNLFRVLSSHVEFDFVVAGSGEQLAVLVFETKLCEVVSFRAGGLNEIAIGYRKPEIAICGK